MKRPSEVLIENYLKEHETDEDTPSKLVISKEQEPEAKNLLQKMGVMAGFMTAGHGEVRVLVSKKDVPSVEKAFKTAGIENYVWSL